MATEEHKEMAPERVNCFIVTVSETRTPLDDYSGQLIRELLEAEYHFVVGQRIIKDDAEEIKKILAEVIKGKKVQVLIFTGGTGLTKNDVTYETVNPLYEKKLTGFGELFRYISFREIGAAAMMSRSSAGIYKGLVIFSLPGSEEAVRLAMTDLILPELGHLVFEISR